MSSNINNLERILRNVLPKENTKIHKLASETDEVLVVSKKAENNSYSFYTPEVNNLDSNNPSNNPKVILIPIDNIFDFLEDNNIIMELTKEEEEEEEEMPYGKNR